MSVQPLSDRESNSNPPDRLVGLLAAILVVTIGYAWMTGRLSPHMVDDTPSYLNYPLDSLRGSLLSSRTPGYPVFLKVIGSTVGLGWVPLVQWVVSGLAAWAVAIELKSYGSSDRGAGNWRRGYSGRGYDADTRDADTPDADTGDAKIGHPGQPGLQSR